MKWADWKLSIKHIDLRTEPGGAYQLELPPGRYQRTGLHLPAVSFEVRDGKTTLDSIVYPAQQPKRFLLHDFGSHPRANPDFSPQLRRHGKPTWTTTQSQPYEVNKLSGLPDSRITALAQDSNGALWVGTAGNLASFNGACLEVYQKDLAHNNRRLWLDRKRERLWLAGRHAVGYIADGYLTKFPLLDEYRSVCIGPTHDGRVCIGTKAGLFFWNDEHFQFQGKTDGLPDEFIKAVLSDPDRGVTWIGTNQGLVAFNGQSYQLYDQHGLEDLRIASLFLDSRGRLWVGTASSLYYFENDQFQLVRKHKTEQIEYARSFVEFDNGAIKVGAYNEFLDIPADFPKSPFTIQPESAPCNAMLLQDKQLWMGFGDGELRREDQALRKPYSIARGACSYLYSIGDHLWFIEETPSIGEAERKWAAVRLNKATYKTTRFPITVPAQDLKGNPLEVKIFYVSKNGVWVGTKAHGVFELRGKDWVALPLPTEQFAEVASMTEDTQKRLWIATLREVFRKQNDKVTRIKLPTMPASTQLLHVGRTPKGRQVLGTTEGVFVLNDKMEILERLHESTGMLSNVPRAMRYGRDGTLWLATFSGLQSIKGDKSVVYNAETGMLDDRPGSFLTIWDDEVWCASHSGINRISVSSGIVQHLLGNDGLGENKIFSASADGDSMWLAGETGVWQYRRGTTPPQLSIDDTFTTKSLGPRSKLSVTTDLTAIQVKLKATSLRTRAGGMIYQYRIGDGEWKRTRPDARVEVPSAGKHHVQFRAIDRDQLISNTQQLSLTVNPPYARWLTNLALIMGTMASGVLGLIYLARIRSEKSDLQQSVMEQSAQLSDLERQLKHSEKMRALGTLASGVAHDFNNSLLAINGNAELALMSETVADKDELLSEVLVVTKQASELTKSMLMFGGKGSANKKTVDVRVPIRNAEKILRRTLPASIRFECKVPSEPIYCEADPSQIQQVVVNLALNARDAMPEGGRLELHAEKVGEFARIVVSDVGCGMSEETQARIFEPFYTEKPRGKGTGLGLAIVHAIVGNHGGEISVDSADGKGAEFAVCIPTSDSMVVASPTDSPKASSSPPPNHGRILLADDESHVRTTLAKALRQSGFEVEAVGDGEEFTARARQKNFDLVVVDVDMPGENGWTSLEKVRETQPNQLAIVISGLPSREHRLDEQKTVFLRKPFSLSKLTETAADLLTRAK